MSDPTKEVADLDTVSKAVADAVADVDLTNDEPTKPTEPTEPAEPKAEPVSKPASEPTSEPKAEPTKTETNPKLDIDILVQGQNKQNELLTKLIDIVSTPETEVVVSTGEVTPPQPTPPTTTTEPTVTTSDDGQDSQNPKRKGFLANLW